MKFVQDTSGIFSRYDIHTEARPPHARKVNEDPALQDTVDLLVSGDEEALEASVRRALDACAPMEVINHGLIAGMKEVSRLWEEGLYFLPQVILSSEAMLTSIALCEQKMGHRLEKRARVVTHTAEGDIHDIGQVIVNALLKAAGFEVIDLGVGGKEAGQAPAMAEDALQGLGWSEMRAHWNG